MNRAQAHRGPDGEGLWSSPEGRVAFGHRRLSILDLSEQARQPMISSDETCVLTFNGEIYNYLEVRTELRQRGRDFRTNSDSEVLLEAYRAWGHECLARLNGMFAFAIYDSVRGEVFCARDRYGEKPLLFVAKPGFFAFASEYKALLQLAEVGPDYDEVRLIRSLHNQSMGLDRDRQTVFDDIEQLLPSEALVVNVATLEARIWRYWDVLPNEDLARVTEVEAVERFRGLFVDSVRIRMRSDVAVGSCLSGGLDSGAIVSTVRKVIAPEGKYHTFTGRFPGTSADEWVFAEQVISDSRVEAHVVEPTPDDFADELEDFLWYNELPVGSSSQYAQYCVFRLAKEHRITVLLDGQGGDELLGGYEQYFQYYIDSLRESGDVADLKAEMERIVERYPLALVPAARALRDRVPFSIRYRVANMFGRGTNLLFGLRRNTAEQIMKANRRTRDPRFNALSSALYQDSFGMYLTTLLRYGDRNSMAHSREVRLPFCDYRLAELVLSLPPRYLMGGAQTKRLLRESMRGLVPEGVRARWNKQGFRPPQETWFRGRLMERCLDTLGSRSFRGSMYWDASWWRRAARRVENGNGPLAWSLWQPFIAEAWKVHFVAAFHPPASGRRISALANVS